MKILAVHNFLIQKRGAELAFLNMVLSLRRRGHEIDVLALEASEYFVQELQENSVRVITMGIKKQKHQYMKLFMGAIYRFRVLHRYYKFAKERGNSYDVAFVHHHSFSPLILPFLGIPKVYYCQEPPRDYYEPDMVRNRNKMSEVVLFIFHLIDKYVDRYCVKHTDVILSNSDYGREYLWRTYEIFPITNYLGIDLKKFHKLSLKKDNIVISIGVIHPRKAHDFVINSIGLIPKEKRPKLIMVGAGLDTNKQELQNMANSLDIKIGIKSNVSDEELVELYNKAKVTAIAYIMEPFGLTAIESMACETPVVAVREGGLRESVTNETGILTNRDEEEFAKAMEYLLDNPEVAAEMGKKGRERVEKYFTWARCAEELEKNLERAIKHFLSKERTCAKKESTKRGR